MLLAAQEKDCWHMLKPQMAKLFISSCGLFFIISTVEMLIHSQWELNVYA